MYLLPLTAIYNNKTANNQQSQKEKENVPHNLSFVNNVEERGKSF